VKKIKQLHSLQKNSFEIYTFLENKKLLEHSPEYWWPNSGSFEVLIGAILTQNTTWKNVEKSLKNLENNLTFDKFLTLEEDDLKLFIHPSGFYNQKAPRLLQFAKNIKSDFSDFKIFTKKVTREWLLSQKGIGEESADAILCYACSRDVMVVDSYTKRLLKSFEIEFKTYEQYQIFLETPMRKNFPKSELNLRFARFHGMIVEYLKSLK
jgi:endonuclease-3 related protein